MKDELKNYTPLFVFILLNLCVFLWFNMLKPSNPPESPKFSIVDKYGKCEVVKYVPQSSSRSYYFLDCSK